MNFLRPIALIIAVLQPFLLIADIQKWTAAQWDELYQRPLLLPELCGTAISEYQVSGDFYCPYSNWAAWEAKYFHNGHPTIKTGEQSGKACDFWQLWPQDIALIKDLGCNSFRFSVEWSAIEPVEGQ